MEEQPATSVEPDKGRWGDRGQDVGERSTAGSPDDGGRSTDERTRDGAEQPGITGPSNDSTSIVRDPSDRLPASLREKMLRDPTFTRLGWGVDEQSDDRSAADAEMTELAPPEQSAVEKQRHTPDQDAVQAADAEPAQAEPPRNQPADQPANASADQTASQTDDRTADKVDGGRDQSGHDSPPVRLDQAGDRADSPGTGDAIESLDQDSGPDQYEQVNPRVSESESGAGRATHPSEAAGDLGAAEIASEVDSPRPTDTSRYAQLVTEHDKNWEPTEAALPPGALPESAKTLSPQVVDAMDPDVRRVLEYQGAAEYITANKDERPWLEGAANSTPQVQRLFVAIDRGTGHAHIRHGPMGTEQLHADRVARLEDPAQTDPVKRALSIDGLDESKQHYCAQESTRIDDPEAFVVAFAAAVKHPDVRQVLAGPWTSGGAPNQIAIPIADLLGPDGHESCSGFRLAGDWSEAKKARKLWVKARAEGQDLTNFPEPRAERIPTFDGGNIIVSFTSNRDAQRYEVNTLYPKPPKQQSTES
ncbi:hypothetical protein [Kribbella sp.]|uniref:hypothetical protein n=1 Tax=Kribbella sp. TaxID=1871183 RepID=UPI002D6CE64F|nr:hypothetical protein [Kribbella sp.]HZX03627.1 hypothetical protein [Kribbella sp.]